MREWVSKLSGRKAFQVEGISWAGLRTYHRLIVLRDKWRPALWSELMERGEYVECAVGEGAKARSRVGTRRPKQGVFCVCFFKLWFLLSNDWKIMNTRHINRFWTWWSNKNWTYSFIVNSYKTVYNTWNNWCHTLDKVAQDCDPWRSGKISWALQRSQLLAWVQCLDCVHQAGKKPGCLTEWNRWRPDFREAYVTGISRAES